MKSQEIRRLRDSMLTVLEKSTDPDLLAIFMAYHVNRMDHGQIVELLQVPVADVEAKLKTARSLIKRAVPVSPDQMYGMSFDEFLLDVWFDEFDEKEIEAAGQSIFGRLNEELDKHDLEFRSFKNSQANASALRDLQLLAAIDTLASECVFDNIAATVKKWSEDVQLRFIHHSLDRLEEAKLIVSRLAKDGTGMQRWFKIARSGQARLAKAPHQAVARVKGEDWDRDDMSAWCLD